MTRAGVLAEARNVAGLQQLWLGSQYSDPDPDAWPADLMEQIAGALGEKYVKAVDTRCR